MRENPATREIWNEFLIAANAYVATATESGVYQEQCDSARLPVMALLHALVDVASEEGIAIPSSFSEEDVIWMAFRRLERLAP